MRKHHNAIGTFQTKRNIVYSCSRIFFFSMHTEFTSRTNEPFNGVHSLSVAFSVFSISFHTTQTEFAHKTWINERIKITAASSLTYLVFVWLQCVWKQRSVYFKFEKLKFLWSHEQERQKIHQTRERERTKNSYKAK